MTRLGASGKAGKGKSHGGARYYQKLLAGWRTETREIAWKDMRWPAVWAIVSVAIGWILIN